MKSKEQIILVHFKLVNFDRTDCGLKIKTSNIVWTDNTLLVTCLRCINRLKAKPIL